MADTGFGLPKDGGGGGITQRSVLVDGGNVFASVEALVGWGRLNLQDVRNNSFTNLPQDQWNRSLAQVSDGGRIVTYQWYGLEDRPTLAQYDAYVETPWRPLADDLTGPEIVALINATADARTVTVSEKSLVAQAVTLANNMVYTAMSGNVVGVTAASLVNPIIDSRVDNTSTTTGILEASEIDSRISSGVGTASAAKRFDKVEPRRANFTISYTGTDDNPGTYFDCEDGLTATLGVSSSDDDVGSHWGFGNTSLGADITLAGTSVTGRTSVLEGQALPARFPPTSDFDLVLLDRTATTDTYRLLSEGNGPEGMLSHRAVVGSSITIIGVRGRPVQYDLSTSGTANFFANITSVGSVPSGESCQALIRNADNQHGCNLTVPTGSTFEDTATRLIPIPPRGSLLVTIANVAGALQVIINQKVEYRFLLTTTDILNTGDNKADWDRDANNPELPLWFRDAAFSPTDTASMDRITAGTGAGFVLEFQLTGDFDWGGASNPGVHDLLTFSGDRNSGVTGVSGGSAPRSVEHRPNVTTGTISRTWTAALMPGDFFRVNIAGLPATGSAQGRVINAVAIATFTLKR